MLGYKDSQEVKKENKFLAKFVNGMLFCQIKKYTISSFLVLANCRVLVA